MATKIGISKTFKKAIGCEVLAFFLLISMTTGAATFCLIIGQTWGLEVGDWIWLAIAASLRGLPKVYTQLKKSREPWLVRFARAYREGFLSLALIAPDLSTWFTKVRGLWRNLNRKPEIAS